MATRPMTELVVGLDGSVASACALRWAASVLRPAGRIHAVHAVASLSEPGDPSDTGARASRWCAGLAADLTERVEVLPREVVDDVASGLIDVAEEVDAGAIVVGHHPRPRFGPRAVGHVTADLLRRSNRPVVIVPHAWEVGPRRDASIVVGVGVAGATRAAIRWALEFAGGDTGRLRFVHAFGPRSLFREDGLFDVIAYQLDPTVVPGWIAEDIADLAEEVRASLAAADLVSASGGAPTVTVKRGRIGRLLVAEGEHADLLVVGRSGEPFRRQVMAPYLHRALTHAPCPVAVVPAGVASSTE